VTQVGDNVVNRGVPWIAVGLTMFWCLLESVIFTYVMTPLVLDTLSNMTGTGLSEQFVRIPLFLFMLFIVLGSYSVLSTWTIALRSRNAITIVKIGVIESVAMFVEVVFLYREFVDALVHGLRNIRRVDLSWVLSELWQLPELLGWECGPFRGFCSRRAAHQRLWR